jgi:hypothetical protein
MDEHDYRLEYLVRAATQLSKFLETKKDERVKKITMLVDGIDDGYPDIDIETKSGRIYHYEIMEGTMLRWGLKEIEGIEGNGEYILKEYELLIPLPEKPQNLKRD